MKKVIAACIERFLDIDTPEEAAAYIEGLRNKETDFVIVSREEAGGKYRIRVKEQYNKSPMIQD